MNRGSRARARLSFGDFSPNRQSVPPPRNRRSAVVGVRSEAGAGLDCRLSAKGLRGQAITPQVGAAGLARASARRFFGRCRNRHSCRNRRIASGGSTCARQQALQTVGSSTPLAFHARPSLSLPRLAGFAERSAAFGTKAEITRRTTERAADPALFPPSS